MTFDTQTIMMVFFIFLVAISFYKIRQFLPQEQLADDDTTEEAIQTLEDIVIKVLNKQDINLDIDELFEQIKKDEDFDEKRFWRFNQNRLNHLLADLRLRGLISI